MSIRYELIIYWSDLDQSFIVEVPELPGCMADGKTYEEAVANTKQVIKEWIETARELGKPVPDPKGSDVCVTSPSSRRSSGAGLMGNGTHVPREEFEYGGEQHFEARTLKRISF